MNSPIPGTTIQSLMFPKARYTSARAAAWAQRNGFDGSAPDVGSAKATMIRVRLKAPTRFVKGSFKTIPLSDDVKAVIGVAAPAARKNPVKLRRNTVVGDHAQVHGYTRKLPGRPVAAMPPARPTRPGPYLLIDDKVYRVMRFSPYEASAHGARPSSATAWGEIQRVTKDGKETGRRLSANFYEEPPHIAISFKPRSYLSKSYTDLGDSFLPAGRIPTSNPSQEATMAGRPKSRARRNPNRAPVSILATYGVGDSGMHPILDQALEIAELAKSLPVPYVSARVSQIGGPDRAATTLAVSLDPRSEWNNGNFENSRHAKFMVDPKDGSIEQLTGGKVPRFRKARFSTPAGAIAKIAKWAEGATTKSNPRARRNPLTVNPPLSTPDIKLHKDGRVTYWSVYEQRWVKGARVPDRELAAMSAPERKKVQAHLARHGGAMANPRRRKNPNSGGPYYTIVTFGYWPGRRTKGGVQRVFRSLSNARKAAEDCPNHVTCRIYECDSLELARTADISEIRRGERIA